MSVVYTYKGEKNKLYVNIIRRWECTNRCIFCNKEYLNSLADKNLYLKEVPSPKEILRELEKKNRQNVEEIVFCGIGEPTLYFDTLIDAIKKIKEKYSINVRLNTNGQANLINPYRDVVQELKNANLDKISISLNAITKEGYNYLHRPIYYQEAFESVIEFIKECVKKGLDTYVSFIELDYLDKERVLDFVSALGVKGENVIFRKLMGPKSFLQKMRYKKFKV